MMAKKKPEMSAIEVLRAVRDDIKEMEWDKLGEDGILILVAKAAVLEIVTDWIEYVLAPNEIASD